MAGLNRNIKVLNGFFHQLGNIKKESSEEYNLIFRGQANEDWEIKPSAYRYANADDEAFLVHEAIRRNPSELRGSNMDSLIKLQHYGIGTRLLDVTSNPLVALYFATEHHYEEKRKAGKNTYEKIAKPGVVYWAEKKAVADNDLFVRVSTGIPFIDFTDGMPLEEMLDNLIAISAITDKEKIVIQEMERDGTISNNIEHPVHVTSSMNNQRITHQSGSFLISPSLTLDKYGLHEHKSNMRPFFAEWAIVIDDQYKDGIRKELDLLGINESTLFPEFEHQLNYLKQRRTR